MRPLRFGFLALQVIMLFGMEGDVAFAATPRVPRWKVQVLIYSATRVRYTDSAGHTHDIVAQMSDEERSLSASASENGRGCTEPRH